MQPRISRHNIRTLIKLSALSHKNRKSHLKNWPDTSYKDIKNICLSICKCKRIPKKTLNKLHPHRKNIRKISKSNPAAVKKILLEQKGGGIFTALAAGLIPMIVNSIVKATS